MFLPPTPISDILISCQIDARSVASVRLGLSNPVPRSQTNILMLPPINRGIELQVKTTSLPGRRIAPGLAVATDGMKSAGLVRGDQPVRGAAAGHHQFVRHRRN